MYDGRDIANRILDICDNLDVSISNLALQKIIFFCHVWTLRKLENHWLDTSLKHGNMDQYFPMYIMNLRVQGPMESNVEQKNLTRRPG